VRGAPSKVRVWRVFAENGRKTRFPMFGAPGPQVPHFFHGNMFEWYLDTSFGEGFMRKIVRTFSGRAREEKRV
jgi:hypothetical protein